jgi:hypothetical protein
MKMTTLGGFEVCDIPWDDLNEFIRLMRAVDEVEGRIMDFKAPDFFYDVMISWHEERVDVLKS